MASAQQPNNLGQYMLQTAWIFQALTALPITVILGFLAFLELFQAYFFLYGFITDASTAILAAAIIFLVLVQRKLRVSPHYHVSAKLTLIFEVGKLILAFALWLWLILDAAFGPWRGGYGDSDPNRVGRVVRAAICFILIIILFIPTVCYAVWEYVRESKQGSTSSQDEEHSLDTEGEAGETSPLLGSRPRVSGSGADEENQEEWAFTAASILICFIMFIALLLGV